VQDIVAAFRARFGAEPTHIARAPGRVNLIGEHTDYHDGYCFPAAIDAWVTVAARLNTETILSTTISEKEAVFSANSPDRDAMPAWARYPAGVAWAMGSPLPNVQALVDSTLPVGSGLSSSAALEMTFATLWRLLADRLITDAQLAKIGQTAENEFVGMNCGIMDQTASLMGRAGHALFLDTADPGHPTPFPLPYDIAIVICDTGVKHELAGSEYNLRRKESESAAMKLGVAALRWATFGHVAANRHLLTDVEYRRAKHVITECSRVLAFRNALEVGDQVALGELLRASHSSLRDDYEVSCKELDVMSVAANRHPDCLGARMMGGGFGGACIALVKEDGVEDFALKTAAEYLEKTGLAAIIRVCHAVDGAAAHAL
jgi:galactokinase